ncbi:NUDIX hydrolase [Oceanicola sp. S124]|uniref:NUDIX hydrolase n=1 Tax=Oceanicola sp. S124 TaxID=1042378 RepID=UPI0002557E86|nr:NUDIX hydrolase [Oceanicola sp. S124]
MLRQFWNSVLLPVLARPARYQVAALCHRGDGSKLRILLITSRDTGRWVLPKGWPKRGHDAGGTALEEAWEEAGIKPCGRPELVGRYHYHKRLDGGLPVPTRVEVFAIPVSGLHDDYPEKGQRKRHWMTPAEAASSVAEPELAALLARFRREAAE